MKKTFLPLSIALATLGACLYPSVQGQADKPKPLRVLIVAGGCCHDYATQTQLLKDGIESRLNAVVDIAFNPDKTTKATFPIYASDDWAKDFDVILHDECSADVTERPYVSRIIKAHRDGKPAVNLHCAMHSYRWDNFREPVAAGADNAGWYEMIGIQSTGHGPQSPIDITFTDTSHPLTKGLLPWTTINEELYNNVQIFPTAKPLASGRQMQLPKKPKAKGKDAKPVAETEAKPVEANAVVAWTNEFGPNKTRIFSTTLGHNNDTVSDPRYLDLVTRGLLWSTDKLQADGTPALGYSKP
jgi:type 1 glutamine amidotransferase